MNEELQGFVVGIREIMKFESQYMVDNQPEIETMIWDSDWPMQTQYDVVSAYDHVVLALGDAVEAIKNLEDSIKKAINENA